jgi:hypothetical protein
MWSSVDTRRVRLDDGTRERETEPLCRHRQRREQHRRIIRRNLKTLARIHLIRAVDGTIEPDDIREEDGVEVAGLEFLRERDPEVHVVEVGLLG